MSHARLNGLSFICTSLFSPCLLYRISGESEKNIGSGASNAGIMRDSYVTGPKTEVINGKRYDVGGIDVAPADIHPVMDTDTCRTFPVIKRRLHG